MTKKQKTHPYHCFFSQNTLAVIDLPLKLIVSLTISAAVILSLIGFFGSLPFPTSSIHVTIHPTMDIMNITKNMSFIHITLKDSSTHNPISNGLVTIKGYDVIFYNQTNKTGECTIPIQIHSHQGTQNHYLDLTVKAAGYDTYEQNNAIRILFS